MESNGFYVTLPSNSSIDIYPNNTLTKYIVRLPRTLYLKEGFEVALAEIMYPVSWNTMSDPNSYAIDVVDLKQIKFTTLFIPQAHYQSIEELINKINEVLHHYFDLNQMDNRTMRLVYDSLTEKTKYRGKYGFGLRISNELRDILGFEYNVPLEKRLENDEDVDKFHKVEADFKSNLERGFHALYVYCNVCKPQIVGDVYAPLLRTVAIMGKRNQHVNIFYNKLHYIPVRSREIDEIEIDIRDDTGNKVPFTFGKVVCKLHFRQNEALRS